MREDPFPKKGSVEIAHGVWIFNFIDVGLILLLFLLALIHKIKVDGFMSTQDKAKKKTGGVR